MDRKIIYILHGWAIDHNNQDKWQPFINALQECGVRGIFLKIPGLSTQLDEPWHLQNYIDWLKKQLPEKGKVILLGHSFGGHISARFAIQHPDMIEALILMDASGIRDANMFRFLKRKFFFIAAKIGKPFCVSANLKKFLYKLTGSMDYYQADKIMRQTLANVIRDEVSHDLQKIACPTLIIWGRNEAITPLPLAYKFHKSIKNSELKIVDSAGHSPQFTHTREAVKLICDFLS